MSLKLIAHYSSYFSHLLLKRCLLCGDFTAAKASLCQPCQENLPILTHSCEKCAQFLPSSQLICGQCLSSPPPFDKTHALFHYQPPLSQLIIKLKFKHQLIIAHSLGILLAQHLSMQLKKRPDLILPMPLHHNRLKARGFNQAVEIAKPLAKALKLPIGLKGISRSKETLVQSSLTKEARKQNVKNAFEVTGHFSNLHLAVVDDVMTTGHTMRAFCQALKEKGAAQIEVWCLARSDIAIDIKSS